MRVGLSAGDVRWEDDDCHGTPVVTAARLCDRAVGGQILVDDLVRGLARGRTEHTFRLVGELELKGLADRSRRTRWRGSPRSAIVRPSRRPLLPIAGELPVRRGRDAEARRACVVQWKSAQTDGRAVALVSGEPGVGKTRLTAEARARRSRGGRVGARGPVRRADRGTRSRPGSRSSDTSSPHAMASCSSATSSGTAASSPASFPSSRRRVDDVPEPRKLDPETEQLALFDAVVDVLETLAADAPVFLVIDDAHWADAASLGLLRHTVRHLPAVRRCSRW